MTKTFNKDELELINNAIETKIEDYEYLLEEMSHDKDRVKDIKENLKEYNKINKKLIKEIQLATIGITLT